MPTELFSLAGRVVVLTGGAGLLGREYCFALAQAGAHVVISDINASSAEELATLVTQRSQVEAMGIYTDVSEKASVQEMVNEVLRAFGRIDVLVNNAALDPKFDPEHAHEHGMGLEEYPLELWNLSVAVNLTGPFLCCQAVAPAMLAQGKGVIVNVSSTYGLVGPDQRLYEGSGAHGVKPVAYSVTKSGILGLTHYLATYWRGKNIRVNTLSLGGVYNGHDQEFTARYSYRTLLGRMADKSEYCGALLFLASDASSYMTGANLVIDGGWTAW